MSIQALTDQGKEAFIQKQYSDAVNLYTKALSISKSPTETRLIVLDLRCQAYAKLGNNDLALQDARHMIHASHRQSSKGYLRCSQIERNSGNLPAAIRWLEHGSRNIPQHRTMFEAQVDKLQALLENHVALHKRQDPITAMPLELIHLTISFLDYREVVLLLRVCKTWKTLLTRLPPLTTTIDFTDARAKISYQACSAAIRRLCRQPSKLILKSLSQSAVKIIHAWLAKYTNLESLEVLHFNDTEVPLNHVRLEKLLNIKSLQVGEHQRLTLNAMLRLTASCPLLQHATMSGNLHEPNIPPQLAVHKKLQHLRLSSDKFVFPARCVDQFPNLECLHISGGIAHPERLDLSKHDKLRILRLCLHNLEDVDLDLPKSLEVLQCVNSGIYYPHARFMISEPVNLPNLHTLTVEESCTKAAIIALHKSDSLPQLLDVSLRHVPSTLLSQMSLRYLELTKLCQRLVFSSEELENKDVDMFAAVFPAIQVLTLNAPKVTGAFISDLIKKRGCRLKKIVLNDCSKVAPDIGTWLPLRGIQCYVNNTADNSNRIRHVRENW